MHENLGAWLRLTMTRGVGNDTARRLLTAFGLPEAIFEQSIAALQQVVKPELARALLSEPADWAQQLDATLHWLDTPRTGSRQLLSLGDPQYPASLLTIEDPPLMLYAMGASDWLTATPQALEAPTFAGLPMSIAIVGSRNPTPQGEINARQFALALRDAGLTVVSGLALGVDAAAHRGALASQATHSSPVTVAVVGTGLDRVYPHQHLSLAHEIAERGLLLSEFPLGTPPLAPNFPRRNRLISALSQGTLVIEAALKSGSLITARMASEQGREVFAIPGSIHSPQARGCHALIQQGAKLVASAQDVLSELRLAAPAPPMQPTRTSHSSNDGPSLLDHLGFDPVSLDALLARTGLATAQLQAQLLNLELGGQVARLPGGLFQRLTRV